MDFPEKNTNSSLHFIQKKISKLHLIKLGKNLNSQHRFLFYVIILGRNKEENTDEIRGKKPPILLHYIPTARTKVSTRTHTLPHLLKVFTGPQWDGGAPVSVSGNCPVMCIFQPISKPLFSHKLWYPDRNELRNKSRQNVRKSTLSFCLHKPLCNALRAKQSENTNFTTASVSSE